MKKISVLILFCLIILTALTKNSSKNLESQIFLKNETISLLKEKNLRQKEMNLKNLLGHGKNLNLIMAQNTIKYLNLRLLI